MPQQRDNIREGMEVYDTANTSLGRVERVAGNELYVAGQRIPLSAVARVERNRIYLSGTASQFTTAGGRETEGEIRVPVMEERLEVEKRPAELGEVQVRREVTEEQQSVPVELRREEVHVEQRDVGDRPISPGEAEQAFQEGTIRVPVRGEEAVVSKEAVVTGEVAITKEQTTERQEVTDTVRRMRVDVDENYQQARSGFQQHFQQRQGTGRGTRTFEQAEPNYRWGFEQALDERYAGREFDDVESDLRRAYESRGGRRGDSWEELREEIREGWNRARRG
jgi:uncharacterized protein (TIGR02271 family)